MISSSAIIWLMVAAGAGSHSSPAVLHTFPTEQKCEEAADELSKRSKIRGLQKGRYFTFLDAICLPVPNKKEGAK